MKWLLYYYFKSLGGPSDKRVQFSFIQYKHSTVYELCATVADADNGHNKMLGDKVLVTDWHLYSKRAQKKSLNALPHIFVFKYILSFQQLSFYTVHPQGQDSFISVLCIRPSTPSTKYIINQK